MTPENFIYWLQGALEIHHTDHLDSNQIQIIQDHLNLVLKKETPERKHVPPNYMDEVAKRFELGKPPFTGFPSMPLAPVITC